MQPAMQSPRPTVILTAKPSASSYASYHDDWPTRSGSCGPIRPTPSLANTTAAACAAEPTWVTGGTVREGAGVGWVLGFELVVGAGLGLAPGEAQPMMSSATTSGASVNARTGRGM